MGLGFQELLVIFLIVVLMFGAKKIPELASGIGKGIKNFKTAMSDDAVKPEEVKPANEATATTQASVQPTATNTSSSASVLTPDTTTKG